MQLSQDHSDWLVFSCSVLLLFYFSICLYFVHACVEGVFICSFSFSSWPFYWISGWRLLLYVTRLLSRWVWFVHLGTAIASSRRVPAPSFWHRSSRRPFCSNLWLQVCTAVEKDCGLPRFITGLLQPTDTHLETFSTFCCSHLAWLGCSLINFWLVCEWPLSLCCVLKSVKSAQKVGSSKFNTHLVLKLTM